MDHRTTMGHRTTMCRTITMCHRITMGHPPNCRRPTTIGDVNRMHTGYRPNAFAESSPRWKLVAYNDVKICQNLFSRLTARVIGRKSECIRFWGALTHGRVVQKKTLLLPQYMASKELFRSPATERAAGVLVLLTACEVADGHQADKRTALAYVAAMFDNVPILWPNIMSGFYAEIDRQPGCRISHQKRTKPIISRDRKRS